MYAKTTRGLCIPLTADIFCILPIHIRQIPKYIDVMLVIVYVFSDIMVGIMAVQTTQVVFATKYARMVLLGL